jgi:hypothetical protein
MPEAVSGGTRLSSAMRFEPLRQQRVPGARGTEKPMFPPSGLEPGSSVTSDSEESEAPRASRGFDAFKGNPHASAISLEDSQLAYARSVATTSDRPEETKPLVPLPRSADGEVANLVA